MFRNDLKAARERMVVLEDKIARLSEEADRAGALEHDLAELRAQLAQAREREQQLLAELGRADGAPSNKPRIALGLVVLLAGAGAGFYLVLATPKPLPPPPAPPRTVARATPKEAPEMAYKRAICRDLLGCYSSNEAWGNVSMAVEAFIAPDGSVHSVNVSGTPPDKVRACLVKDVAARRIHGYSGGPARIRCITAGSLVPGTMMTNTDWQYERLEALPQASSRAAEQTLPEASARPAEQGSAWSRCVAICEDKTITSIVRDQTLRQHCQGKRVELEGWVHDVSRFTLFVDVDPGDHEQAACSVDKTWLDRAGQLKKRQRVRVAGTLKDCRFRGLSLEPCELQSGVLRHGGAEGR